MSTFLILTAAAALAFLAYLAAQRAQRRLVRNPLAHIYDVSSDTPAWGDALGERLGKRLPLSWETWEAHLDWAQRGGKYQGFTVGRLVFLSLLMGGGGLLLLTLNPDMRAAWLMPAAGLAAPFIWVRSAANKVRRATERQLPELAALMAAETAAGTPAEEALVRASRLPGTLSEILSDAVYRSQRTARPLLTRGTQRGTLREVFADTGVPALRAFAVQIDVAAARGVGVSERMTELSQTLADEYRQRLMQNIEKLETNLTTAVAAFYFLPMVLLVMIPLFVEAMRAL